MAGVGGRSPSQVLPAHGQGPRAARRTERLLESHQQNNPGAGAIVMRKVVTISLNGNAYQIEEGGYEALRAYLEEAQTKLREDPDRSEILADLEQAIADKCSQTLRPHKSVVTNEEVARVLGEMGPVDGAPAAAASAQGAASGQAQGNAQTGGADGAAGAGGSMGEGAA